MTRLAVHRSPASPRYRLAAGVERAPLRDLLARAARPGVISFAVGMPAQELLPAAAMARAAAEVCAGDPWALQYGLPSARLKSHVVDLMARRGVDCRQEQVFLTTGAQQGMDLLARLLVRRGDEVLLEETIYDGMSLVLRQRGARILTVPTSSVEGIDVEAVARVLAAGARPAFLYVVPAGHNPLGVTLGVEVRRRLAALARRYEVPVLEDDAYGLLSYRESAAPALRSFDERWVFYLGSFSKILAPALRVGWIVVPEELQAPLTALKHLSDLDTATYGQRLLAAYLDGGDFSAHLERARSAYRERRDAMLAALEKHFPGDDGGLRNPVVRWSHPTCGMYVWLEMTSEVDSTLLLGEAIERESVAFSPGQVFAAAGGSAGWHALRLAFADARPDAIAEGVARLARALEAHRPALSLAS